MRKYIYIFILISVVSLVLFVRNAPSNPNMHAQAPVSDFTPTSIADEATSSSVQGDEMSSSSTEILPQKSSTSASVPKKQGEKKMITKKTALLADGCFWCVEHDLEKVDGVVDVVSGYAGGNTPNPTYETYIAGGYREAVMVTYDASMVSYANLVEHIIKHGDPTDANGSFHDRGMQYAPAVYYTTEEERIIALKVISAIDALHVFDQPLPLVVIPGVQFWPAEEYHQNYGNKNPVRYNYYRSGSGRDAFIKKYWGENANQFTVSNSFGDSMIMEDDLSATDTMMSWDHFVKPREEILRATLSTLQYQVTQENGTEPAGKNLYDKNYEPGIYVDIISGEPLYSSSDKYDSGTGWPSFVKPITKDAVVLKADKGFFTTRTEVRSRYADSHLGHVFDDGPVDRGGKRYCMNSAAMRFIPKEEMASGGYQSYLSYIK